MPASRSPHPLPTAPDRALVLGGAPAAALGLRQLRGLVNAVPQRPVLMRASLRTNLDPWRRCDDARLVDMLHRVCLYDRFFPPAAVEAGPAPGSVAVSLPRASGLDTPIEEDGGNLSMGERQLICAARAMLRRDSKVIVADECTASVDSNTGTIIERVLHQHAKETRQTLIVVSHRIQVPWTPDLVVVMEQGAVREAGTWQELESRQGGAFRAMLNAQKRKNGEE
jgi:ABC-type multidrug transport system fused ATPase/permease subunit